jgi:hypothetical protein
MLPPLTSDPVVTGLELDTCPLAVFDAFDIAI